MIDILPTAMKALWDEGRLLRQEPMSSHTTLKIGGPADWFAVPKDEAELIGLLKEAKEAGLPVTVIGKGSNLLVLDGGIRGLVIQIDKVFAGVTVQGTRVSALSGTSMAALAKAAADAALTGLEFASGIPGTVGGGVFMNAGAYGGEMKDVVTQVHGVNYAGETFSYAAQDMRFAYRHSRAQEERLIITRIDFELAPGDQQAIFEKMADLNARRRDKQPLLDLSCGSTFTRPPGHFAGTLIEQCGLKGVRVGMSEVSQKHAGFLINHEGGTAKDFLALIALVQKTVFEKTGVKLEPEVRILGEEAPVRFI